MTAPLMRVRGKYPVTPGGPCIAPSVTAISGMVGAGAALVWGATKVCAHAAVYRRAEWEAMSDEDAYHWLRKLHDGEWKAKSARGTAIHDMAHQWALGRDIDCPPDCNGYLDALERFYVDHQPEWLHCERTVIYDKPGRETAGTFDAAGVLKDGRCWLLDWKSGKRYPAAVILQMSGYRYATEMAVVDEIGQFIDTEPMFEVDACGVVYLHSDGTYELLELPVSRATHAVFLALRDVWAWQQEAEAWLKRNPAPEEAA